MPRSVAVLFAVLLLAACTSTVTGQGSVGAERTSPSTSGPPSRTPASSSPRSGSAEPTQPPARFTGCPFDLGAVTFPADRAGRFTFGCAQISVPLNYADPDGKRINLFLIKVHFNDAKPVGSLIVNPGGPGASGLDLAVGLAVQVSLKLLRSFDIVGFDPRGVGLSSPVRCLSDADKDRLNAESPDVSTAAGFAEAKATAKQVADACTSRYGSDLPYFNTIQTARDIDQIREAVGDDATSYLGISYGTELGSIYAHLYPQRVRVAVLDGAVNPLTDDITASADQLKGFEAAFDQFAAWCRKQSDCADLPNPREAVYELVDKADAHPLSSSGAGETRKVTSSYIITGVLQALYSQSLWDTLRQGLIEGLDGDGRTLLQLADQYNHRSADGTYTNIADANQTIGCNDAKPGPSDETIRSTATEWAKEYPIFGAWAAPGLFSCQQWQPQRTPLPLPTAPTPTKVLVVGNVHDPATPYQGAIDLAKTMGNAEVLSWDGEGHASYLSGSDCIDSKVEAYLIAKTLPPDETLCPA